MITSMISKARAIASCGPLIWACAAKPGEPASALRPASGPAPAQARAGQSAPSQSTREERFYDPATVQTLRGSIVEVEYGPAMRSESLSLHVILQSGRDQHVVHLGPSWYIEQQPLEFEPGNAMEVTGSRLELHGRSVILARAVTTGGKRLTLRDPEGAPLWVAPRPGELP